MSTSKKRINISIPKDIERAIAELAKRDETPQATKAGELLRLAIQFEEDQVLDAIATARDKKNARFIPHKNVWA